MRLETRSVVMRPIEEVWTFIVDPFNVPRWGGGSLAFRWTSPGPPGVGSHLQQRVVMFGFERAIGAMVTEWDPPHAMTVSTKNAGVLGSFLARIELKPAGTGTKITTRAQIEPHGGMRLLSPLLAPLVVREANAQARRLKRLLESGRG